MRETVLLVVFMSLLTALTVQPIVGDWCRTRPCHDERSAGCGPAPTAWTSSFALLLHLALDDEPSPLSARDRLRAEAAATDRPW